MRILHLDSERTWRGGERQALYLARGLRERGHECLVVAPPEAALLDRCGPVGVPVYPLAMRGELDLWAAARLARLARRYRPDLVHCHSSHAHLLALVAHVFAGGGVQVVVSRRVDFPIGALSARLKYRFGVKRFLAVSRAVAEVLERGGVRPDRIAVVHSGIDPTELAGANRARGRRSLGVTDGVPLVGTLSHLAQHKGIEHLVRAWPEVLRGREDARLAIAGDGPEAVILRRAIEEQGLEEQVELLGFRRDTADCLAAFDLFVLPSVTEGLGTTLLDALALGKPAVASDVGGIPEVIEDGSTGLLVPPADSRRLADAIGNLLDDPRRAAALGEAGRRRVLAEFTAEAMVSRTERVYREVLGTRAPERPRRSVVDL